ITARFCNTHKELQNICSIQGCFQLVQQGCLTCSDPEHLYVQTMYEERGKSMLHL
ncbi:hypothetical protein DACRYDRAFT_41013, partial [Dacryopinax primogenitus]